MVGYMCGVLFDDWSYLDACESGDLHTSVARMVWERELPWTGDLRRDRAIAERHFHRHFTYRDACKRIGHGRNFYGKPPTLSKETGAPLRLVAEFCEKYDDKFPCIRRWWQWTASEIQRHKRLVTIHGRHRDFFDRTDSDETLRKALAFLAAAATADNINLGLWRVWKHMPGVRLLGQVHDSIVFQFSEKLDKSKVAHKAQSLLETRLTHGNKVFVVPTEVKMGYNWGNWSEKNPKGMRKFKP
jgi:DNA polymerase I-like protein with 3'-5' exonuclease and polymerase domains